MRWFCTLFVLLVLVSHPLAALAQGSLSCSASLSGAQVVPPSGSDGTGWFALTVVPGDGINWDLRYSGLPDSIVGASLHLGLPDENGPVLLPLADGWFENGTYGWIAWNDSLNVLMLESDHLYVVYHSRQHPDGALRGQLGSCTSPIRETSWGRIRSLYRDGP